MNTGLEYKPPAPRGFAPEAISVSASSSITVSEGSTPIPYDVTDHNVGSMSYANAVITVPNSGYYSIKSGLLFQRTGVLGTLSNVELDIEVDTGAGWSLVARDQVPDSTLSLNEQNALTPHRDVYLPENSKVRAVLTYNSTLSAFLSFLFPNTVSPVNFLAVHKIA